MPRGEKHAGGRPKGSRNKRTIAREKMSDHFKERLEGKVDEMPLDYLLRIMNDPMEEPDARRDAAKAAAPYLHSRMPQKVSVSGDLGVNHTGRVHIVPAIELPDNGRGLPRGLEQIVLPPSEEEPE